MTSSVRRRSLWTFAITFTSMALLFAWFTQVLFARFEGRTLRFHEALLFVGETLSTTGYGEQGGFRSPVTTLWSLMLMGTGFMVIFVWLASLAGGWLSDRFQPRASRKAPRGLSGHAIIVGTGPVAQYVVEECLAAEQPYLLVDQPGPALEDALRHNRTVMEGDALVAETLQAAGIDSATAVVVTLSDPDNASVCLVARSLRSDLPLHCTVEHAVNQPFLAAAGAARTVSAKQSLGRRLAWLCTAPLSGQLDRLWGQTGDLSFCQVPVLPGSTLANATLRTARIRERTGSSVLGLWHHGHFVPAYQCVTPLKPGQVLIAAGRADELTRLRELTQSQARSLLALTAKVLVLGAGDVGLSAIEFLRERIVPYTVLSLSAPAGEHDWVQGDATDRAALEQAGIQVAGRCLVALDDDSQAVFATLMARQLNPALRIVARANSLEAVPRLYLAGADNVLSVSEEAGRQLARLIMPQGVGPPALDELAIREVPVPAGLTGRSLTEGRVGERTGCLVLAIRPEGGEPEVNPSPQRKLLAGETLLLFGTEAQFDQFSAAYETT